MKAAIIENPGVLSTWDVPIPVPGAYDALCQLLYGSTCTGTDLHLLDGTFPFRIKYPTVFGHESIGRIVEVGPRVRFIKTGDLVSRVGVLTLKGRNGERIHVNWGGFAQYGIARDYRAMQEDGLAAKLWQPFRIHRCLPSEMNPALLTMVITWRETLSYFTRMGISQSSSLLVIGSGGNGLAFAAHAAAIGIQKIVLVGNIKRKSNAHAAGATDYYDYKSSDLTERILANNSKSFDFLIDAIGNANTVNQLLRLLKPAGTIGIYGIDEYHNYSLNPHMTNESFSIYNGGYDESEVHERVMARINKGQLRPEPWLDTQRPFPLTHIRKAIEAVRKREYVKALIKLS